MEHPELQLLIQKSINRDRIIARGYDLAPANEGNITRMRNLTGNVLMTIGERIAVKPRPESSRLLDSTPVNGVKNA